MFPKLERHHNLFLHLQSKPVGLMACFINYYMAADLALFDRNLIGWSQGRINGLNCSTRLKTYADQNCLKGLKLIANLWDIIFWEIVGEFSENFKVTRKPSEMVLVRFRETNFSEILGRFSENCKFLPCNNLFIYQSASAIPWNRKPSVLTHRPRKLGLHFKT